MHVSCVNVHVTIVWHACDMQDKHAEDSDSEREEMEMGEIVKLLEKHDPSYMRWVLPWYHNQATPALPHCMGHYFDRYSLFFCKLLLECIVIQGLCYVTFFICWPCSVLPAGARCWKIQVCSCEWRSWCLCIIVIVRKWNLGPGVEVILWHNSIDMYTQKKLLGLVMCCSLSSVTGFCLLARGTPCYTSSCRAPEVVFQPPMVGVDQSGLAETMDFVLQYYSPEVQQRLVQVLQVVG